MSNGINVRYGMIDPFAMAASCVDEAVSLYSAADILDRRADLGWIYCRQCPGGYHGYGGPSQ